MIWWICDCGVSRSLFGVKFLFLVEVWITKSWCFDRINEEDWEEKLWRKRRKMKGEKSKEKDLWMLIVFYFHFFSIFFHWKKKKRIKKFFWHSFLLLGWERNKTKTFFVLIFFVMKFFKIFQKKRKKKKVFFGEWNKKFEMNCSILLEYFGKLGSFIFVKKNKINKNEKEKLKWKSFQSILIITHF